ncbi:hypothetical protein BsWGS_19501 [Bradybaena similaris]
MTFVMEITWRANPGRRSRK